MKNIFLRLPEKRLGWFILHLSINIIFTTALFFQYIMDLQPCVMCIEERILILCLSLVSLIIFAINPSLKIVRFIGYSLLIAVSIVGFNLTSEHISIQDGTAGLFATCSIYPRVPDWLPLHEWLPALFQPTGDCGDIDWSFFNLSMVEWVRIIFSFYIALPLVMIIGRKGL